MRILLIEDSPDDRFWLSRMVTQWDSGVELTHVSDAERALEQLQTQSFDLILTDQNLPGQTGLDLIRTLREQSDWTPVVVITGRNSLETASLSASVGAAAYLAKDTLDEKRLVSGIERAQGVQVRALELDQMDLDLPGMGERISQRVMATFDGLRADMEAVRRRPNRQDDEVRLQHLDHMEAQVLAIEARVKGALGRFSADLT